MPVLTFSREKDSTLFSMKPRNKVRRILSRKVCKIEEVKIVWARNYYPSVELTLSEPGVDGVLTVSANSIELIISSDTLKIPVIGGEIFMIINIRTMVG